jgi:hypothetical protein
MHFFLKLSRKGDDMNCSDLPLLIERNKGIGAKCSILPWVWQSPDFSEAESGDSHFLPWKRLSRRVTWQDYSNQTAVDMSMSFDFRSFGEHAPRYFLITSQALSLRYSMRHFNLYLELFCG